MPQEWGWGSGRLKQWGFGVFSEKFSLCSQPGITLMPEPCGCQVTGLY